MGAATRRRQRLEAVVDEYLGPPDSASERSAGAGEEGQKSRLASSRLNAALLAGLGPRQRKRTVARLREAAVSAEDAMVEGRPLELAANSVAFCAARMRAIPLQALRTSRAARREGRPPEALPATSPRRATCGMAARLVPPPRCQQLGLHCIPLPLVRRQQVVARLLESGGEEALGSMVQRFRAAFVEATAPQHMPSFWKIDHKCAACLKRRRLVSAPRGEQCFCWCNEDRMTVGHTCRL